MKTRWLSWLLLMALLTALLPLSALAAEEDEPDPAITEAEEELLPPEDEAPDPAETEDDTPPEAEETPGPEDPAASEEDDTPAEDPAEEEPPEEEPPAEAPSEEEPSDEPEEDAPPPETEGAAPERTGKTISILGDSISAYYGWSEGAAADTTNRTIRQNAVYYTEDDIAPEQMWWYLAAEALGAELLVNNSWSGSCVLGENEPYAGAGSEGWGSRCLNLHDNTGENAGEEPDIICVMLGSNDLTFRWQTLGSAAAIDYDRLIRPSADGVSYAEPKTSAEAYAVMLDRISRRYPNAEIYCFSLLTRRNEPPLPESWLPMLEAFNATIQTIAARYGAYYVDIYSLIPSEASGFDVYMMDRLHPNAAGMQLIADAFIEAVRRHTPAQPVTPEPIPGDADDDGALTAYDAALLLRHAVGYADEPGPAADINGDGLADERDAARLLAS